tara:strand:+ start:745 stop:876 length:132 start_codon:yes stop_codon:yes gene_type:complete
MNSERHRKKLLADILLAIEEIDLFFEGTKILLSIKTTSNLERL